MSAAQTISQNISRIFNQKRDLWIQISKSYSGGKIYRESDYLHKFSLRESANSYEERKKRAVYLNNVQPLADLLTGFIFSNNPLRSDYSLEYLIDEMSLLMSADQFMQNVCLNSLLYGCGILVDSPSFDPQLVETQEQRIEAGLNPYAVLYMPWQIRNFCFGRDGKLKWLLLDNTRIDNDNYDILPILKPSIRLWTPVFFQDYNAKELPVQGQSIDTLYGQNIYTGEFVPDAAILHPCKEVPFQFVNWSDRLNSHLADTVFEDIALFDQAIYNYMSLMDEMVSGGVFKYLFFPNAVPDEVNKSKGFANMAAIPSPGEFWPPFFAGPTLADVDPFLSVINFHLISIKRALGLDTDQEKQYAQSGAAKRYDYTKVRSLLKAGVTALEIAEKKIFYHAGLWEGRQDETTEVQYRSDFLDEDEESALARLYDVINLPYRELKKQAAKKIAQINFGEKIPDNEMDTIIEDIEMTETKPEGGPGLNTEQLAALEKGVTPEGEIIKTGETK